MKGNDLELGFCFINKPNPIDFVLRNLKQQNMSTQCQVHIQAFPNFRISLLLHLHHYLPILFLREIKNPSPAIIPWISTSFKSIFIFNFYIYELNQSTISTMEMGWYGMYWFTNLNFKLGRNVSRMEDKHPSAATSKSPTISTISSVFVTFALTFTEVLSSEMLSERKRCPQRNMWDGSSLYRRLWRSAQCAAL